MKIDVGNLCFVPPNPRQTQEYRKALLASKDHLNTFLSFEDIDSITFKDFSRYLAGLAKLQSTYPCVFVSNETQILGNIQYTQAWDKRGVQFLYWIRKGFEGNGIISQAVELQSKIAFVSNKYEYIEIHTDKANLASRRIPEKLGFQIEETYSCPPIGRLGTGEMDVWVKWNPQSPKTSTKQLPPKKIIDPFRWGQGIRNELLMVERALRFYSVDGQVYVEYEE